MNDVPAPSADQRPTPLRPQPPSRRPGLAALLQTAGHREYREMEHGLRASGGLANTDDIIALLGARTDQPISTLAHWIVAHDLVSFEWNSRTMLPVFQFELATMTVRPEVTAIVRELAPAFSDWEICLWFARPNAWLGDASPVDHLAVDAAAVFDAARADRYLARS